MGEDGVFQSNASIFPIFIYLRTYYTGQFVPKSDKIIGRYRSL